jgi:1-pyrroline-5-carboxylate dehydrogenase
MIRLIRKKRNCPHPGAFEYQGQKCSAASRAYIPDTIWDQIREFMQADLATMKMGEVADFSNFMNAVIDEKSFDDIVGYIENATKQQHGKNYFRG